MSAVEQTTKYATTVESLGDAWAFVMEHIDSLGDAPTVHISPLWSQRVSASDDEWTRRFEVAVSGMTEIP